MAVPLRGVEWVNGLAIKKESKILGNLFLYLKKVPTAIKLGIGEG